MKGHKLVNAMSFQVLIRALIEHVPVLNRLDSHMKEVASGATVAFVLRTVGTGLGFFFNLMLARLLHATGTGIYYQALTVINAAYVLGQAGLYNVFLRFTAANASRGDWEKVAGMRSKGLLIAVTTSTIATVSVIAAAPWIAQRLFLEPSLAELLQLMAFSILPFTLATLYAALLRGLENIQDSTFIQGIGIPLFSVLFLAVVGDRVGVKGAGGAYVLATLVVWLLGFALWRRTAPHLRGVKGDFNTRFLLITSLPLFWVAVMNLVMSMADTFLLGIWMDSDAVGIYSIAKRISTLASFILVAINTIVAPKFATLYAQGEISALGTLARNITRVTVIVGAVVLSPFLVAPRLVLSIFGPEFTAGVPVLVILSLGQFVNVATGSVGYLLMMTGHEKSLRDNMAVSVILYLVLSPLLIVKYGIVGAAISTAISLVTLNVGLAILVYLKLSIVVLPLPGWVSSHVRRPK